MRYQGCRWPVRFYIGSCGETIKIHPAIVREKSLRLRQGTPPVAGPHGYRETTTRSASGNAPVRSSGHLPYTVTLALFFVLTVYLRIYACWVNLVLESAVPGRSGSGVPRAGRRGHHGVSGATDIPPLPGTIHRLPDPDDHLQRYESELYSIKITLLKNICDLPREWIPGRLLI